MNAGTIRITVSGSQEVEIPVQDSKGHPLKGYTVKQKGRLPGLLVDVRLVKEPYEAGVKLDRETRTKTGFLSPKQQGLEVVNATTGEDVTHKFVLVVTAL